MKAALNDSQAERSTSPLRDLASGARERCIPAIVAAETEAERVWNDPERPVACLSLRSGFDLFLQVMDWPYGRKC